MVRTFAVERRFLSTRGGNLRPMTLALLLPLNTDNQGIPDPGSDEVSYRFLPYLHGK
jgi:hypothetical protein